jgi:group I intron endonuclease
VKKAYIYLIENVVNGNVYVGKTLYPQKRWSDHKTSAGLVDDYRTATPLYRAMRKYGLENFTFSIIDEHEDERYALDILEPKWITYYKDLGKRLYNLTDGGDGLSGYNHTNETKEKISRANSGRAPSPEVRKRISEKLKGNVLSEDARRKISEKNKGRPKPPRSDEHCKKLSEVAKARGTMSEEQKAKISASMKQSEKVGHAIDDETKEKIAAAQRGRVHTEDEKMKRSDSLKRFYEELKARGEKIIQRVRTPEEIEATRQKRAESLRRYHERRRAAATAQLDVVNQSAVATSSNPVEDDFKNAV